MPPSHAALAIALTAVWGLNFVMAKLAVGQWPPLLLTACRFLLVGLLLPFLPRPKVPLSHLLLVALSLFVGQFAMLFGALRLGMLAGLSSIILQVQVPFTVLLTLALQGGGLTWRQAAGLGIGMIGMALLGQSVVGNLTIPPISFAMVVAGAVFWAVGNVQLKRLAPMPVLPLMVWLSVLSVPPLLALSLIWEGPAQILATFAPGHLDWIGWGTLSYVAFASTLFGYGAYGWLLARHPAAQVAPITLMVPLWALTSSSLILGEEITLVEGIATGLTLAGVALIILPAAWFRRRAVRAG